nr:carboxypeptidase Q-like [Oncorhynchus nerka]
MLSVPPLQVVLLSGHLDSWDVGQGAMDDGGGALISWEALSLLKDLGLRPRRTLRTVLWSAEEQGGVGAQQYFQLHKVSFYHGASCWLFTVHLTCTPSPLSSCHTVHPIALKLNSGPGSPFHCFVSLFPSNQGLI